MGIFDQLRSFINPNDYAGVPKGYDKEAGVPLNMIGFFDSILKSNPNYMQDMTNRAKLGALEIKNEFMPQSILAANKLKNASADLKALQSVFYPENMQIKRDRLDIDKQRFSPQQLEALRKMHEASALTAGPRVLSSFGKTIKEGNDLRNTGTLNPELSNPPGYAPPTAYRQIPEMPGQQGVQQPQQQYQPGQQIAPDEAKKLAGLYNLKIQKEATDKSARDKALYATNVEKTLQNIDPSILSYYSGPEGKLRLAQDAALGINKASPEYKKYVATTEQLIPLFVSQVRQFYGDSIQPSVREHLEKLANTSTWRDPDIAMNSFNQLVNVLNSELSTYRNALKDTGVFFGNDGGQQQQPIRTSFSSKDDFDKYYMSLNDSQRAQLKAVIGGK